MVAKWVLVVLVIVSMTVSGPYVMADLSINAANVNGNTVLRVSGVLDTSKMDFSFTHNTSGTPTATGNQLQGGNRSSAISTAFNIAAGDMPIWASGYSAADRTSFGAGLFLVGLSRLWLPGDFSHGGEFSIDAEMTFMGKDTTALGWTLTPFDVKVGDGQFLKFFTPTGPTVEEQTLESANTTGVPMSNYNVSSVNNITSTILGGLHNGRMVRARSHLSNPRLIDTQSWVAADRSLSNYLHFAGNQGISVRQALGLDDIPVSASVTGVSAPIMMGLAITSPKAPLDPKVPLEEPKRWELYTVGDIGDVDQDALDTVNRGYRNRTYAGSVGAEYLVSEHLNVGTAFSYADSDTDFSEGLGTADIDGQLGSVYATYFKNSAYVDALYSYGAFDHDLVRTTLGGDSIGNTESNVHSFSVNAGQNFDYKGLVTGPTVGLDHSRGTIDAYTETGGLPLNFADRNFQSTISSLGWQISKLKKVNSGLLTVQGSASWDHEYQPEGGAVSGSLVADPTIPFNGVGAGPGTDWLNLGLGVRLLTDSGIDIELDYQTQLLREDVTAYYGGLKFSTKF